MVERVLRRETHKTVSLVRPELLRLVEQRCLLAHFLNLAEVEFLMLELGQIIDTAGVLRSDVVDLREVLHLDDGEVDVAHHLGGVLVQVLSGFVAHHSLVQLARLVILAYLTFVV